MATFPGAYARMAAAIDSTIFINKADLLSLSQDDCDFTDLHEAVMKEAGEASEIVILGGWCKPRFILDMCRKAKKSKRRDIRVRIGVGRDMAMPMLEQWKELQKLRLSLTIAGFVDPQVRLVSRGGVHFHTKLFGFLRATQWSWYVGSANPTDSTRHEMMVRVGRRHEALKAYVNQAIKVGIEVTGSKTANEIPVASIDEFFLRGHIAYKPTPSSLFAFDAMRLTPTERTILDVKRRDTQGIRHAKVETRGYGFLLLQAMGNSDLDEDFGRSGEDEPKRLQFKKSSIETPYGWWVPPPYAAQIHGRIEKREDDLERRLLIFLKKLQASQSLAKGLFGEYAADMQEILQKAGLKGRPVDQLQDRFGRFLERRLNLLHDEEGRRRMCRVVEMNPMPNFLQDERAYKIFCEGFFEYVAFRSSQPLPGKGVGSIIERLKREEVEGSELDWEDPISLMEAFKKSIHHEPWNKSEWRGVKSDDQDE